MDKCSLRSTPSSSTLSFLWREPSPVSLKKFRRQPLFGNRLALVDSYIMYVCSNSPIAGCAAGGEKGDSEKASSGVLADLSLCSMLLMTVTAAVLYSYVI